MRFKNKSCLVTGAASGIGLATARQLAREGGSVVIADLNPDHGNAAAKSITDSGGRATFAKCDVSQSADVRAAIDQAFRPTGRLDVLVNNAAMMTFANVTDLSESDWDRVLAVNLKSVFLFCKYGIPHMPAGSSIVNTSSVHAFESEAGVAPYAASKGGLQALTRVLALELADKKIRINCVAPGAVDTPMLWNNPNVKSGKEKVGGAIGTPDELAAAICFLAAPESRFVNGTTLVVDGARLDML